MKKLRIIVTYYGKIAGTGGAKKPENISGGGGGGGCDSVF
jgi:hypothetical protein